MRRKFDRSWNDLRKVKKGARLYGFEDEFVVQKKAGGKLFIMNVTRTKWGNKDCVWIRPDGRVVGFENFGPVVFLKKVALLTIGADVGDFHADTVELNYAGRK